MVRLEWYSWLGVARLEVVELVGGGKVGGGRVGDSRVGGGRVGAPGDEVGLPTDTGA